MNKLEDAYRNQSAKPWWVFVTRDERIPSLDVRELVGKRKRLIQSSCALCNAVKVDSDKIIEIDKLKNYTNNGEESEHIDTSTQNVT